MKDPIKVLAIILIMTLIIFIDMCTYQEKERDYKRHNTRPDSSERVKIKIC